MKYYSQYHSHELFELQESLSGLSKSNRIVSIYQPHLRPIVRGKAKAKVEFGAKIGASIVNGYTDYSKRYFAVKEKKNSKAGMGG